MTKLFAEDDLPATAVAFRHGGDIVVLFDPDTPPAALYPAIGLAIAAVEDNLATERRTRGALG